MARESEATIKCRTGDKGKHLYEITGKKEKGREEKESK